MVGPRTFLAQRLSFHDESFPCAFDRRILRRSGGNADRPSGIMFGRRAVDFSVRDTSHETPGDGLIEIKPTPAKRATISVRLLKELYG